MHFQLLSALRQHRRGLQTVASVLLLTFTWLLISPVVVAAQPARAPGQPPARVEAELAETLATLAMKLARFRQQLARAEDTHTAHDELRTLHHRLKALDRRARQAFDRTAQELGAQGLPAELLGRHAATVTAYQTASATLQRHLEALDTAQDAHGQADHAARAHQYLQDTVYSRLPKHVEPAPLPFRAPDGTVRSPTITPEAFDASLGTPPAVLLAAAEVLPGLLTAQAVPRPAPPSAEDLAPTEEVQLTDEIRALAASLGNNPVRIFNWVHDQMTFLPTYGAIQGAVLTLQTRQGNAFDTASLLVALLRAAGIHARYAVGTVQIPIAQVLAWVGAATPEMALEALRQGGIPSAALVQGGVITAVKLEHVWVEAWIDFEPSRGAVHRQGDTWVPLDASFKRATITSGQALPPLLLEDVQRVTATLLEQAHVRPEGVIRTGFDLGPLTTLWQETPVHLLGALPAATPLGSVLGQRSIVPSGRPALAASLPYTVLMRSGMQTALTPAQRHHVQLALFDTPQDRGAQRAALTATLGLPLLQTQRLSVTWEPATPADAALLERLRTQGAVALPVYLLQVRPLLQLDGVTVAGGPPLPMGQPVEWAVALVAPDDAAPVPVTFRGRTGDAQVFGLNGGGLTPAPVLTRLARSEPRTAAEDLHLLALQYWLACDHVTALTAQRHDTQVMRLPSVAMAAQPLVVTSVFGLPYSGTYQGHTLDVAQSLLAVVAPDAATRRAVLLQTGLQASYLAGAIFESVLGRPQGTGRSAVSLLVQAAQQGIPLATLTADNVATLLPQLPVRPDMAATLREAVAAGYLALLPTQPLAPGPTATLGAVVLDPLTGAGAYLLDNGVRGGAQAACQARSSPALATVLFPALTMILADLGPAAPLAPGEPALAWLTAGVLTTMGVTALATPPDTLLAPSRVLVALALVGQVWPQALVDLALVAEATAADCGAETTPLVVTLHGVPASTAVGHPVILTVTATGANRVATLALWINDQPQPLDARGRTTYTPHAAGPYTVLAVAQDGAGNTGRAQATFVALDATQDTAPPVATLTPLNAEAPVTAPTVVRGTVEDATLVRWTLAISPRGAERWTTLATGTTAIPDGVLGTLDPTLLPNDLYEVRLVAEDVNGQITTTTSVVQVSGGMKIGHLRFTLEDLSLPLLGLPVTVERTYDSRDTSPGDFGAGWRLDLQTTKLRLGRPLGTDWTQEPTHATFPRSFCLGLDPLRTVTITLPDGRQEVFDLVPTTAAGARNSPTFGKLPAQCQWLVPIEFATAVYQPRSGTLSTLEALADKDLIIIGGPGDSILLFSLATLDVYAPTRFRLTTPEGLVLVLDQDRGVEQLTDPNGNTLIFGPDGLRHSAGTSVSFTRDGQGRITRITDPMGHSLQYTYDAAGDLVAVTDQAGQTTRYTYDTTHKLLAITDPRGVRVAQTRYDAAGRLIAHIDADGHRVAYTHDIAGRQEVVRDRLGHVTVYAYDERGNVLRETDPLGHIITRTYDSRGNLLTQTDPLGNTTTYTYDLQNNILTATDALGHTTTYTYNTRRQLLSRTDPLGQTTTYTYDANGNLLTEADLLGQTTTLTYGQSKGLLIAYTDVLGHTTRFEYNAAGHIRTQTNALGHTTTYTYDANGNQLTRTAARTDTIGQTISTTSTNIYDSKNRVVQTLDPDRNAISIEYNTIGKQSALTDRNGNRTEYVYDLRGNHIRTVYPDGLIETAAYDANGNQLSVMDKAGRTTQYTYDALNRRVSTTFPDGNLTYAIYDAAGRVTARIDENGNRRAYIHDRVGRQTASIDALGYSTTFAYDANGDQISTTDPSGNTTRFEYDSSRKRTKEIFPDGTAIHSIHDRLGRKIAETNQEGYTTRFAYDALGNLTTVIDALGHQTTYTYDELGNLLTATDANGHTTQWAYDNLHRMVKRTLPLGMSETITYDPNGNVLSRTGFQGRTSTLTYDKRNRLTLKTYPDDTTVRFTYTSTGQRATVTDARGITSFHYDARDRLITVVNPDNTSLIYTYDPVGNRTTMTAPAGTTRYTYDALHRLLSLTDPHGNITTYVYDSVGNRVRDIYPNSTSSEYIYDALHRLISLSHSKSSGEKIAHYLYTLGAAGNRLSILEQTGRKIDYTYNALYILLEEAITDPVLGKKTASYTYDPVGNRLTKSDSSGTTAYTYDANDRLLTEAGTSYTYDEHGNTVQQINGVQTTTYTYDFENRLRSVHTPSHNLAHTYDADGVRVSTTVDGVVTAYIIDTNRDFSQVVEERDANGSLLTRYTYGNQRISQEQRGNTFFYHADVLGSVRTITDSSGNIIETYTYDAFGTLMNAREMTGNAYLFAGEQLDPHLGLYYLRARYVDPKLGRFLSADPFPGKTFEPITLHKYLYARGNPVNHIDPSGLIASLIDTTIANAVRNTLAGGQIDVGLALLNQVFSGGDAGLKGLITGAIATFGGVVAGALLNIVLRAKAGTLLVYRIEGIPNTRVVISNAGEVTIHGNTILYLNFGDRARAEQYLAQKVLGGLPGATIKSFEVSREFFDEVRSLAVPQHLARQFPDRPFIADITKTDRSYGLRPQHIEALQRAIIQGSGRVE